MKWNFIRLSNFNWLKADRAQHNIQPFIAGECGTRLAVSRKFKSAQLDSAAGPRHRRHSCQAIVILNQRLAKRNTEILTLL
jgi:hypothetical protein